MQITSGQYRRRKSMKAASIIETFLVILTFSLIFTVCDTMIGLGSKVNTGKPKIESSGIGIKPGSFINGEENIIWFNIKQDQGFPIVAAYLEVEF